MIINTGGLKRMLPLLEMLLTEVKQHGNNSSSEKTSIIFDSKDSIEVECKEQMNG